MLKNQTYKEDDHKSSMLSANGQDESAFALTTESPLLIKIRGFIATVSNRDDTDEDYVLVDTPNDGDKTIQK